MMKNVYFYQYNTNTTELEKIEGVQKETECIPDHILVDYGLCEDGSRNVYYVDKKKLDVIQGIKKCDNLILYTWSYNDNTVDIMEKMLENIDTSLDNACKDFKQMAQAKANIQDVLTSLKKDKLKTLVSKTNNTFTPPKPIEGWLEIVPDPTGRLCNLPPYYTPVQVVDTDGNVKILELSWELVTEDGGGACWCNTETGDYECEVDEVMYWHEITLPEHIQGVLEKIKAIRDDWEKGLYEEERTNEEEYIN